MVVVVVVWGSCCPASLLTGVCVFSWGLGWGAVQSLIPGSHHCSEAMAQGLRTAVRDSWTSGSMGQCFPGLLPWHPWVVGRGSHRRQVLSKAFLLCVSGGNYIPTFGRGTSLVVHPCEYYRNDQGKCRQKYILEDIAIMRVWSARRGRRPLLSGSNLSECRV